ncbi:MAG TPA: serine hydrolase [Ignavibacteria bacterium]|nr:serine hydrolase [Ignavibacteria bacterium]HMR42118.1 serine hydrolase [Ignavibacteria bacterium]
MFKDVNRDNFFYDLSGKISDQYYPNIHSLIISKNGSLIFEQYFKGHDQNFGKDTGIVMHTSETLHDLRSITKSFVSACIGIAIDKNLIKNTGQKISDFFPEYNFHGEKALWNIYHFLTMTTGLKWDESLPYHDHENDEIKMTHSTDPVRFVLDKPLAGSPGHNFNYCGGATQILAEIIERSSDLSIENFANEYLFSPLGINSFEWNKFSVWNGSHKTAASSGLRLTSGSLMKFGMMYRNNGLYNGYQILTPEWIKESFTQRMEFPSLVAEGHDGYGYQFWMWKDHITDREINIVAAKGFGDQSIYWDLENDLTVITTAGNYDKPDTKNNSYAILRNEIYPFLLDN